MNIKILIPSKACTRGSKADDGGFPVHPQGGAGGGERGEDIVRGGDRRGGGPECEVDPDDYNVSHYHHQDESEDLPSVSERECLFRSQLRTRKLFVRRVQLK